MTINKKNTINIATSHFYNNSVVELDGNHFVVAHYGENGTGKIKTFHISETGVVTQLHSLQHDAGYANSNSLIKINDTHVALAYTGVGNKGKISTFQIDTTNKQITKIHTLEHESTTGVHNGAILLDSNNIMVAYQGGSYNNYVGKIRIFSINSSYQTSVLYTLTHDTTATAGAFNNFICKIGLNKYLLFYYNNSTTQGNMKVLETVNNQQINIHNTYIIGTQGNYANICIYDINKIAISYTEHNNNHAGIIKTYTINNFALVEQNSLQHDSRCFVGKLKKVSGNRLLLSHTGIDNDGFIKMFSIDSSGVITQTDSLEYDLDFAYNSSIAYHGDEKIAVPYRKSNHSGVITSFSISSVVNKFKPIIINYNE